MPGLALPGGFFVKGAYMKPEVQPKDCGTCQVMEEQKTMLHEVARHFMRSHPVYLAVLKNAVYLALAQKTGVLDG